MKKLLIVGLLLLLMTGCSSETIPEELETPDCLSISYGTYTFNDNLGTSIFQTMELFYRNGTLLYGVDNGFEYRVSNGVYVVDTRNDKLVKVDTNKVFFDISVDEMLSYIEGKKVRGYPVNYDVYEEEGHRLEIHNYDHYNETGKIYNFIISFYDGPYEGYTFDVKTESSSRFCRVKHYSNSQDTILDLINDTSYLSLSDEFTFEGRKHGADVMVKLDTLEFSITDHTTAFTYSIINDQFCEMIDGSYQCDETNRDGFLGDLDYHPSDIYENIRDHYGYEDATTLMKELYSVLFKYHVLMNDIDYSHLIDD